MTYISGAVQIEEFKASGTWSIDRLTHTYKNAIEEQKKQYENLLDTERRRIRAYGSSIGSIIRQAEKKGFFS